MAPGRPLLPLRRPQRAGSRRRGQRTPDRGAGRAPRRPALSMETTERRRMAQRRRGRAPEFRSPPVEPGWGGAPGYSGLGQRAGWTVDTPAKGIIAISLIFLIYAIAVTPISPVLIAVALDGLGVAAVVKALSDPSGTVSDTYGRPIRGATAVLEQGPTAEGPFMPAVASSPGIEPHINPQKTND